MVNLSNFSGSNIDKSLYDWILNNLEHNKTILEFGSGAGSTQELSKYYKLISIEHDLDWVGKYKSNYIYAPIVEYNNYRWYNVDIIKKHLKNKKYDLILIDGPLESIGRMGFYYNIDIFNLENKLIIVDDITRKEENDLFNNLNNILSRKILKKDNWGVLL